MNTEFPQYQKSDFGPKTTWDEYGAVLEKIYKELSAFLTSNNLHPDAVVPIFRGGGIAAQYLAYKLQLLKIVPVQYKYLKRGEKFELVKLQEFRKELLQTDTPTLLVVENNHCFGTTSQAAVDDLKKLYPDSKILYTAAWADYSHKELRGVDAAFYGKFTNETKTLSEEEASKLGISMKLSLFPWEDIEEELAAVTMQDFNYR